jgi:hypothetical protein
MPAELTEQVAAGQAVATPAPRKGRTRLLLPLTEQQPSSRLLSSLL